MTRVGWCPGGRPVAEMLAMYPETRAVRIFYGPGDGLPAGDWTNPRKQVAQVPPGSIVVVSHKDQAVDAAAFVDAWQVARPDVLLVLIAHHEPEQQKGGDPTPEQFRASWARQRVQVANHPARAEGRLALAVCYTLQWIRGGGDWRTWWPENAADTVDLVLFDWYQYEPGAPNPFRPRTYEDPASALAKMLDIAAAVGKPWGIAEIDHLRITKANGFAVDLDVDGSMCAAWYRRMFAAAKAAGCELWCHFHRGHGDLTTRLPEQQALRELIEQEANDVGAQRRLAWINRGSPFRLMTPLAQLRDRLRGYGYTVYDIGNRSHLEHDPPEDHTPYSGTGYPGEAQYGVGYAIDIMPPPAGSGLPSLQKLGAQLLADRKGGVAGAKWLKYMNWEPERDNGGPCYKEAWRPTYKRTSSTDRGHIHLSGLTGYETSTIAAGYDPVARIRGEDDDMPSADEIVAALLAADLNYTGSGSKALPLRTLLRNLHQQQHGPSFADWQATKDTAAVKTQLASVTAAVGKLPALVGAESTSPAELTAALDQVAGTVADRVLAALPDGGAGPIDRAELEAALRTVLGSLNDAPQE